MTTPHIDHKKRVQTSEFGVELKYEHMAKSLLEHSLSLGRAYEIVAMKTKVQICLVKVMTNSILGDSSQIMT